MNSLRRHSTPPTSIQSPYSPCQCLTCGSETPNILCPPCERGLHRHGNYCQRCAESIPPQQNLCGACTHTKSAVNTTYATFNYQFPVDQLINNFKHQRDLSCASALIQAAIPTLRKAPPPQVLVPVPLHWRRRLFRGFNQAEIIARELGQILKIPVISLCRRNSSDNTQQGLTRKQRLQNLKNSFRLKESSPLENIKHVAIVDDVVTTGATGESLAQLLRKGGVQTVDLWALAKTLANPTIEEHSAPESVR